MSIEPGVGEPGVARRQTRSHEIPRRAHVADDPIHPMSTISAATAGEMGRFDDLVDAVEELGVVDASPRFRSSTANVASANILVGLRDSMSGLRETRCTNRACATGGKAGPRGAGDSNASHHCRARAAARGTPPGAPSPPRRTRRCLACVDLASFDILSTQQRMPPPCSRRTPGGAPEKDDAYAPGPTQTHALRIVESSGPSRTTDATERTIPGLTHPGWAVNSRTTTVE